MKIETKENEYFLIKQIIEDKLQTSIALWGTNENDVIKFRDLLAGTVAVYIYNEKTNQRIDLTEKLGKIEDIDKSKKYKITTAKFTAGKNHFQILKKAYIYDEDIENILKNNFNFSVYYKETDKKFTYSVKSIDYEWIILIDNKKTNKTYNYYGNEYEKYIGKKYEEQNKKVIYNGINKKRKDGGIDLIINEENKITFVQCKNWKEVNHFKLNQRDIRAFIGDCYMYMFNNKIDIKHSFHFIVSDERLLTDDAKWYIKNNKKLKFKIIPFEEEKI